MVNKAVKKEKKVTDISSKKFILYLNPKMIFSPRKRTKYLYFAKGVFEEIFMQKN